jgi:phosphate transport system substrate-binding protein
MFVFLTACDQDKSLKSGRVKTTPGKGRIQVLVEQSLAPAILPQEAVFEHLNPETDIELVVLKESEAIERLINNSDTGPVLFIGRQLKDFETAQLKTRQVTPRYLRVARDAVGLMVHKGRGQVQITYDQALQIMKGTLNNWSQLGKPAAPINLVFDRSGGGVLSFVLAQTGQSSMPANAFGLDSLDGVLDYVSANPNALALIGWSYLSDSDSPDAQRRRSKGLVVGVSPRDTLQGKEFFGPYPVDVGLELYPLTREIYAVNIEGYDGLATGFTNFVASERGQRILLRAGLVAAMRLGRDFQVVDRRFRIED